MLDEFTKHMKRSTAMLLTLVILMTTGVVAYAVINYITTGTQTSVFTKKEYFEMDGSQFFTAEGDIGPGESMSINPIITSESSVDMYVFIRVEMPIYDGGGLYELNVDSGWSLVESGENDGTWVEVYRYDDVLTPEQSTTALSNSITMVDMTLAEFAEISDIDVSMTGYACRVSDVTGIDEAWDYIKSEAGF